CSGSVRPGLVRLAEAVLGDPLPPVPPNRTAIVWGLWPQSFNLGTYNCRRVAGSASLRKSAHGEGRALDVGFLVGDPSGHPSGWALAYRLVAARDQIGLSYLVWAGQSWKAGEGWRAYSGKNPHFDHIHLEVTRDSAERLSAAEAQAAVGPPTTGGVFMALSDAEQAEVLDGVRALLAHWEDPTAPAPLVEGSPAWMFRDWNAMFRAPSRGVVVKGGAATIVNVKAIAKAVVDELVSRLRPG
ncbi:MAG: extensin family protein, partial [bacterium]|nr:extensin family protein [bacterium]